MEDRKVTAGRRYWRNTRLGRALAAHAPVWRAPLAGLGLLALAGCNSSGPSNMRAYAPIPPETVALMNEKGTSAHSPMLIRAYKKEAELEIWKMKSDGRYTLLKTFPMCRWSGQLGPKRREGDRQVPEGFYMITPGQMNPNSAYYLSFNVGYPNAYDRSHGYGGGSIMVHGACSSAGCFSMTDKQIAEIYAIARESFGGGQRAIQMQSLPFRMTPDNLAKFRMDPNIGFWRDLKKGADYFEVAKEEPAVGLCNGRYSFGGSGCARPPAAIASAIGEKEQRDEARVAELSPAIRPVRLQYSDGGQHPEFTASAAIAGADVSRPEALALGPQEIELTDKAAKGGAKAKAVPAAVHLAKTSAPALSAPAAGATEVARVAAEPAPAPASGSMFSRLMGRGAPAPAEKPAEAAAAESEAKPAAPVARPAAVGKRAEARPAADRPSAEKTPAHDAAKAAAPGRQSQRAPSKEEAARWMANAAR